MNFDDISKTLLILGAGVGIGYYIWVMRPKDSEITNPHEIDREERMAMIERALLSQEKKQLLASKFNGDF